YASSSTFNRCLTLLTMPSTSGVAVSSTLLLILFSPRPIRVACWPGLRPLPDETCVIRIFLSDIAHLHGGFLLSLAVQIRHLLATAAGHQARAGHIGQRGEGRLYHVMRVAAAQRLGDHVADAQGLEHSAQRTAGDDTGTGRSRTDDNLTGAEDAAHVVVQRAAFLHRNADHRLPRA